MQDTKTFDAIFKDAVFAIDVGDEKKLIEIINEHPDIVTSRLTEPGEWATKTIGDALNGFFKDPYCLWFTTEDPARNRTLPRNIAKIANIIIKKIKEQSSPTLQEQLDYGIRLVAWSRVAADCGVQNDLLDVFIDAGAKTKNVSNDALVNGNYGGAEHLIKRGAKLSLATALCLGMFREADLIAANSDYDNKQFSLVLCALQGKTDGVIRALKYGADKNCPSQHLYSHGTPLHHAVWSGNVETVKVLVEAGADLTARDKLFDGTPLGWATYGKRIAVAEYLKTITSE